MATPEFDATLAGYQPGQTVFGRYQLVRLLGRGGMGVVWLARDENLEREVALKFLSELVAHDPVAISELKRETRRALELTHPHVVRIHDFIDDGQGAVALSMEYVEGSSLTQRRLAKPSLVFEAAELWPWLQQLCEALSYAHTKAKIAHRDLKPSNLMVDVRGDLKVTDFGVSATLSETKTRASQPQGGSGTPVYMSPQQMAGEKPTVTDDIYALGATLYELLTGKPPFYSGNLLLQVPHKVPPSLAARRAELQIVGAAPIPADWEETIAACLAKDPGARPQSAAEVIARMSQPVAVAVKQSGHGEPRRVPKLHLVNDDPVRPAPPPVDAEATQRMGTSGAPLEVPSLRVWSGHQSPASGTPPPASVPIPPLLMPPVRVVPLGRRLRWVALVVGLLLLALLGSCLLGVQRRNAAAAQQHAMLARVDAMPVGTSAAEQLAVAGQVQSYLASAPPEWAGPVRQAWAEKQAQVLAARKKAEQEKLAAARGGLVIRSDPAGAEVWVGAMAQEKTPCTLKELKLGKYPVRVRLAGYEDWDGLAEIQEDALLELVVPLVRSTGTLVLTSDPAGLEVEIRGEVPEIKGEKTAAEAPRWKVKTPQKVALPTGKYTVTVLQPGQKDLVRTVVIYRAALTTELLARSDQPGGNSATVPGKAGPLPGGGASGATAPAEKAPAPTLAQGSFVVEGLILTLVAIPVGEFTMGSLNGRPEEGPLTQVALSAYWLGQTEVTQGQYEALIGSNPAKFKGSGRPVERVSYHEAEAFCRALTERERASGRLPAGYAYRLPTEAQWEYACRAGRTGDYAGMLDELGWYAANSGEQTHAVGQKRANAWGLYDMHGNVGEWCLDVYGPYSGGKVTNPHRTTPGERKMAGFLSIIRALRNVEDEDRSGPYSFRGGSWDLTANGCRSACRRSARSSYVDDTVGFRVALSASKTTPASGAAAAATPKGNEADGSSVVPSEEFRAFVAAAKIGGVFQGRPPRIHLNGRIVRAGEIVDSGLGIIFEGINLDEKTIVFRDASNARIARRY